MYVIWMVGVYTNVKFKKKDTFCRSLIVVFDWGIYSAHTVYRECHRVFRRKTRVGNRIVLRKASACYRVGTEYLFIFYFIMKVHHVWDRTKRVHALNYSINYTRINALCLTTTTTTTIIIVVELVTSASQNAISYTTISYMERLPTFHICHFLLGRISFSPDKPAPFTAVMYYIKRM